MSIRIAFLLAFIIAVPQAAHAKAERTVSHSYKTVWRTALRHLRIAEGHKIVDKDSEAGYVVFNVKSDGKTFKGSLELIQTKNSDDTPVVRLVLRIEDRPIYMESGLLDRLVTKLDRERRNEPRPVPPKADGDHENAPKEDENGSKGDGENSDGA